MTFYRSGLRLLRGFCLVDILSAQSAELLHVRYGHGVIGGRRPGSHRGSLDKTQLRRILILVVMLLPIRNLLLSYM